MAAVNPQTRRDHPAAQRFTEIVQPCTLGQLLRRQSRAKIRYLLHDASGIPATRPRDYLRRSKHACGSRH
jgi:hypothetical protein